MPKTVCVTVYKDTAYCEYIVYLKYKNRYYPWADCEYTCLRKEALYTIRGGHYSNTLEELNSGVRDTDYIKVFPKYTGRKFYFPSHLAK